ncbi:hypothetical protein [Chitinophaga sp.]|uniref:hypothetical protein n=1 Tax=Chitinophaga sp. TaxID=1869181 RepID=UPI0031D897D7
MDLNLFLTIVATVIAVITFYYTYAKQPKEDVNFSLQQFERGKEFNEKLIEKLTKFAYSNNAHNAHLMQGVTFKQGIDLLTRALSEIYNDTNYALLKNKATAGKSLDYLTKILTNNYENMIQVDTIFELYVKNHPLTNA